MPDIALLCGRVLLMLGYVAMGIEALRAWPGAHLALAGWAGLSGVVSALLYLVVYLLLPVLIALGWRARTMAMLLAVVLLVELLLAGGLPGSFAALVAEGTKFGALLLLVGAGSGRHALRPD